MLPPLAAKREIENQVGIERMGDAAKGRQTGLVLSPFEPGDRRLRHAAPSAQLGLREAVLEAEGFEVAGIR